MIFWGGMKKMFLRSTPALREAQRRIDEINWYHDLDFPSGLAARTKSPDQKSHRRLWKWMRGELDKTTFRGKTVLDIGCWDGYWSFYAEKRHATNVLASDDSTQNWSANSGLLLARELMNSSVETRTDVSIYELDKLDRRFDVILCMGVYYHLVDAFYAFSQIRHRCHDTSEVVIEGDFAPDCFIQPREAVFLEFGHGERCFVPTVFSLRKMLEAAYFTIVSESIYHGEKSKPVNRVLLKCKAFQGENPLHCTKPPFGLASYDTRFA